MLRTSLALIVALPLALIACTREDGQSSTTTVRSGTTETTGFSIEPASRLTSELCRHEQRCRADEQQRSDEAKLLAEQNCVTTKNEVTQIVMGSWNCSPAMARAGYEECLAAIRTERCETRLSSIGDIPRCRSGMVCRREVQ